MSPSVREIRQAAEARMRELGPVIREIAQLREILAVTADGDSAPDPQLMAALPGAPANGAKAGRAGVRSPERGPDGRAVRGSNKAVIMEVVCANPGIAAPEIAVMTDLKREVISATIYRLKKQGVLENYGKGVRVSIPASSKQKFILELADSKPGITVVEVADVTGLDPTVVSVTVELLKKKGKLEDHGEGVGVPGGTDEG